MYLAYILIPIILIISLGVGSYMFFKATSTPK